tara:strand:- start:386 stop:502 length:117 start_codon:yes stop_codon:yes gene_type:complete
MGKEFIKKEMKCTILGRSIINRKSVVKVNKCEGKKREI